MYVEVVGEREKPVVPRALTADSPGASAKPWRFILVVLVIGWVGAPSSAVGQSGPVCEQFQLQAYRQQYAGPAECWNREKGMRGASEYCCNLAFGSGASRLPPGSPEICQNEAKVDVDWVFNDRGARSTYLQQRSIGKSAFEAVVGAQAHNPQVQTLLRRCQAWAESYLGLLGEPSGGVTLSSRILTTADCRCISVLPTRDLDREGRLAYRVINSCDGLEVSVQFTGDILRLSPDTSAFSSWAQAGLLGNNQERTVRAPAWNIVNINSIAIRNAAGSLTCLMSK
jgi:hypothetical protein